VLREPGTSPGGNRWRHPYFWAAATLSTSAGDLSVRLRSSAAQSR
jgi:hypothetical protein